MTLSVQNMRDAILKATATELDDWENGNTDLDLYINRSWWHIMDTFDFREKEATPINFPTVAGTLVYDLSTKTSPIIFDALQRVSIQDPITLQHTDLILISDFDYENEYNSDPSLQAMPTRYFRRDSSIYLFNTPDQVYNIYLYYLQVLSDLSVSAPTIPQSWHEIIEQGAIWRAFMDLQDLQKASEWKRHQVALINDRTPVKAKELADTKFAGVQPGRSSYP